jgi:SNF2 family DNA or RNA helicase
VAFQGQLKPFQQEAHDQLLEWGRGLLAVTMGGGKTPITISILETLLDREEVECGLIITPASLKHQWAGTTKEGGGFAQFAPDAHVVVIDGDADARREQYIKARSWAEYIVLGYSQVVDDWQIVKQLPYDFIVMDEVQAIKNPGSGRSKKMEKLLFKARKRGIPIFGLTGQPLENKPEDVFHVCAGIDPSALGSPEIFDRTFIKRNKYGKAVSYPNLDLLHRRLVETIMVRVKRDEIAEFLPERRYEEYTVPLGPKSEEVYATIMMDLVEALSEQTATKSFDLASHYAGGKDSPAAQAQRGRIMSRLLCARMLCDHPNLLRLSADYYAARGGDTALKKGSAYAHELRERGVLDRLPRSSSKLIEVQDVVNEILRESPANKVVLFSNFKPTLTWLAHATKVKSVLYHGGVTTKRRNEMKVQFNTDPDTRLFLATDSGGAGVDLPAGNFLINYDLPFSAGQLDQRNARIDRMSSKHDETLVISFMAEGTIEEFYADIVAKRQRTARAGIDGHGGRSVELPTTSLREFCIEWLSQYGHRRVREDAA